MAWTLLQVAHATNVWWRSGPFWLFIVALVIASFVLLPWTWRGRRR